MLSSWIRVIRIRFLLASVIAVSVGLAISWWQTTQLEIFHAVLTMAGVLALHVSVDLLNDYWDFKRKIDSKTQKTKMSGGTGVLPEGLLDPSAVHKSGITFLIIGGLIGTYFVIVNGFVVGIILAFAILSIYFYSTKIVDSGLAEFFVGVKGTMIVLGTYFIQTSQIELFPILGGIVVGVLSSLVLYITSFPDHDADKSQGRRTLVIVLGKKRATKLIWIFPLVVYVIIILSVITNIFPVYALFTLLTTPMIIKTGIKLKRNYDDILKLIPIMTLTATYSRITGAIFVISFLITI